MPTKRRVTPKQYRKAKSIVKRYESQKAAIIQKGEFGFLYWLSIDHKDHIKYIKAKYIESACKQFMRTKPQSLEAIDYEVSFGRDKYIDISNVQSVKEFIR